MIPLLLGAVSSAAIYNHHLNSIIQLTASNFEAQVNKIRQSTNYVTIVQYYKAGDGKSKAFAETFEKWSNDVSGVFRIGSVDCEEFPKLCEKEKVTEFPTFVVYPAIPMPPAQFKETDTQALLKFAAPYLHSNVIDVHKDNLKTFLGESPSVPKILYFSDKKGVPMLYKGLSVAFEKKLLFGIVRSNQSEVVDQYRVKQFPTILVVKTGEKKPIPFKGEFNYKSIFDFFNIYSEVFVPGGGSSLESSATKVWMTQAFPELNADSAEDICISTEGFCVIYLSAQGPEASLVKVFQSLAATFEKRNTKQVPFKFMRLNTSVQKAWLQLFGNNEGKVVFFNPSKRKRYMVHEGELSEAEIIKSTERIVAGDAKFNRLGDKLPEFVKA